VNAPTAWRYITSKKATRNFWFGWFTISKIQIFEVKVEVKVKVKIEVER